MALLDTPLCDFGIPAPDFSLADPSGVVTSRDDAMGTNGLLIAFICNHCPYVLAVVERMVADLKALQDKDIGVVAVMSNDWSITPSDAPENMAKFAQQHGFTFPYLVDETQSVGRAYGAVCTPDFFGYNAKGELQYRGRLDDARMGDAENRTPELLTAMLRIAQTGEGPRNQMPSMGCSIKWST